MSSSQSRRKRVSFGGSDDDERKLAAVAVESKLSSLSVVTEDDVGAKATGVSSAAAAAVAMGLSSPSKLERHFGVSQSEIDFLQQNQKVLKFFGEAPPPASYQQRQLDTARMLYDRYIRTGSLMEIGLPPRVKDEIRKPIEEGLVSPQLFDRAQMHAQSVLLSEALPRFLGEQPSEDINRDMLSQLMQNTRQRSNFLLFCKRSHFEENIMFWVAVEKFRLLKQEPRRVDGDGSGSAELANSSSSDGMQYLESFGAGTAAGRQGAASSTATSSPSLSSSSTSSLSGVKLGGTRPKKDSMTGADEAAHMRKRRKMLAAAFPFRRQRGGSDTPMASTHPDQQVVAVAEEIYNMYVRPNAPREISAPAQAKLNIRTKIDSGKITKTLFDHLQRQVLSVMRVDILPKFLETIPNTTSKGQWTIKDILKENDLAKVFLKYCKSIYSEENALFYMAVEKYHKLVSLAQALSESEDQSFSTRQSRSFSGESRPRGSSLLFADQYGKGKQNLQSAVKRKAQQIYERFLRPGAIFEISTPPRVKSQIRTALDTGRITATLFDTVIKHLMSVIRVDILPKFIDSIKDKKERKMWAACINVSQSPMLDGASGGSGLDGAGGSGSGSGGNASGGDRISGDYFIPQSPASTSSASTSRSTPIGKIPGDMLSNSSGGDLGMPIMRRTNSLNGLPQMLQNKEHCKRLIKFAKAMHSQEYIMCYVSIYQFRVFVQSDGRSSFEDDDDSSEDEEDVYDMFANSPNASRRGSRATPTPAVASSPNVGFDGSSPDFSGQDINFAMDDIPPPTPTRGRVKQSSDSTSSLADSVIETGSAIAGSPQHSSKPSAADLEAIADMLMNPTPTGPLPPPAAPRTRSRQNTLPGDDDGTGNRGPAGPDLAAARRQVLAKKKNRSVRVSSQPLVTTMYTQQEIASGHGDSEKLPILPILRENAQPTRSILKQWDPNSDYKKWEREYHELRKKREAEMNRIVERLKKGDVLTKYNARRKPVRRRFFVSKDGCDIVWSKPGDRRNTRSLPLADVVCMHYGPFSDRFKYFDCAVGKSWLCLVIEFEDRTIDLYCDDVTQLTTWYLGIQHLSPLNPWFLSRGALLWARANMKIDRMAYFQGKSPQQVWSEILLDVKGYVLAEGSDDEQPPKQ